MVDCIILIVALVLMAGTVMCFRGQGFRDNEE